VALEREYAGKLQTLSKKAAERKAKMQVNLLAGSGSTNPDGKQRFFLVGFKFGIEVNCFMIPARSVPHMTNL